MKACPEFRQQGDNRSTGFIFNIDQDKAVLLRVPDRETHGGKIYPQFTKVWPFGREDRTDFGARTVGASPIWISVN